MSWHIEGCEGACLACLIEETVLKNYGTQGLDFLRRKVGAGGTAVEVTDEMAVAFHRSITDGPIGVDDVIELKKALRAALAVHNVI